ncbi:Alpha/beta hydrolase fold-1 [Lactarius akahatsu]|uniref:Alpha/beta hydrolase fold-1 n=1 Tax=Lactarius akahatsu TaxID=416441 RepID=A0AAD4LGL5_9AGAM|nr:Alpha/beta hydrolase fold-1 [Lactarius akahatsu]
MPALRSQTYVFDARPHYPLLVSVKRYWVPEFESTDPDAITLILAHALSFTKEHWEPLLEDLYGLLAVTPRNSSPIPKIRDVWAIECPNHGEGAVLNEETLLEGYTSAFSWEEYARAVHLVLNGLGKGINVDFKSRNLVGVGHSMGASAIVLTRTIYPFVSWSTAILIEPMFVHRDNFTGVEKFLLKGALKRSDVWPSREGAYKLLRERSLKSWDPRVVDIFVKYGLRELPTLTHPDKTQGVTLSCTKAQEFATYGENIGRLKAQWFLATFCKDVPTHVVFGEIADLKNREFVKQVYGDGLRTTSFVKNAGHLAVYHNPAGVADVILNVLRGLRVVPSKL